MGEFGMGLVPSGPLPRSGEPGSPPAPEWGLFWIYVWNSAFKWIPNAGYVGVHDTLGSSKAL